MIPKSKTILVTGATGKQGGALARELLAQGFEVRALTRRPDSAVAKKLELQGAWIVRGDLNDEQSVREALKGAEGAFLVQAVGDADLKDQEEQGKRFAELARKAEVRRFVYSSDAPADKKTGIPAFESKRRIEQMVLGLGFPSYTILRPVFFMENFLNSRMRPDLRQSKLMYGAGPGTKIPMIAIYDIGRFARLAFEGRPEMDRAEIDIAGDARTMPEAAEVLGNELGRKIEYVRIPLAEFRQANEEAASVMEWIDRVDFKIDVRALSKRYDLKLLTLAQWASRYAHG